MKDTCAINLHNVVTVSKAHLGRPVAMLSFQRLNGDLRGTGLRPRLYVSRIAVFNQDSGNSARYNRGTP